MKRILKGISIIGILFIFVMTFLVTSFFIGKDFLEYKKNNKEIENLVKDVMVVKENNTEKNIIDWEKLKGINADIIGWIKIEDTPINYPILKDRNLLYVNHTYNKNYNNHGSIFTTNTNPFDEQETILYGHNMKDGSMFSILGKYLDNEFLSEHKTFQIYTKNRNYECTVFSVYSIGINTEEKNIQKLNFKQRIDYYKNSSRIKIDITDNIDKIIKLSTCSYINAKVSPTDQRYYIIASIK